LRTCGEVLRSWKVSLELGRGPREKHGLVGENWDHNRMKMGLERRK